MARLVWQTEQHEVGVSRGVLYSPSGFGEAWNGLISVEESPSGGEPVSKYIDGQKFRIKNQREDFSLSIEAFTFPDWILNRVEFGFCYRTSSKIHLVYNARARLDSRTYKMEKHTPFSISLSTKPRLITNGVRSAHLIVDLEKAYSTTIADFENLVYGSDETVAQLPSPETVLNIFEENSILRVIDNGDGTFTVTGPDSAIEVNPDGTFSIDWPSAVYIDSESYSIKSL